jgi:Kef-type K+ transport system membrane component KefB
MVKTLTSPPYKSSISSPTMQLHEIIVYLLAAVLVVPIAKRLKLGSVLGYLVAGVVLGSSASYLGLSQDPEQLLHVAEFGVVLLLFLVGLELKPERLWKLRVAIFGMGGMQVVLTTASIGLLTYALGLTWQSSMVIGMAVAMSSTAIGMASLAVVELFISCCIINVRS